LSNVSSQKIIEGKVVYKEKNETLALEGASVYWKNTNEGTITDIKGDFSLPISKKTNELIISFIGFKTDTLTIFSDKKLIHFLNEDLSTNLDEVSLVERKKSSKLSFKSNQNLILVDANELLKAACCNLSESFETNPSIDVNFSDALTGTKQISMLGLKSPYILISEENIPMVRGASQAFGLTFTPGTWIESIQISKGVGSVVNGFESIAGQINTELKKPYSDNPLFVNLFSSGNGRVELNTHFNKNLSDKWSTGLYIHLNQRNKKIDNNFDGFLDVPISNQVNILNRFQYTDPLNGWVIFYNSRFLSDKKQTGEVLFDPNFDKGFSKLWGSEIETKRWDSAFKLGYVFPQYPYKSFGLQASFSRHDQEAYYGLRNYDIIHQSFFGNLLFNSIFNNTTNKFKSGLNYTLDKYDENIDNQNYIRTDKNIGMFFEWSHDDLEKLSWTAGIRLDFNNNIGTFFTPRLHLRYSFNPSTTIRLSSGSGRKAANIFAENQSLFATNRRIIINKNNNSFYGLLPERAWNYGVSLNHNFRLFSKNSTLTLDYYNTSFVNQVVVDYEKEGTVLFYNLEGNSYSKSFQLKFDINLTPQIEFISAYKNDNVSIDYISGTKQKQLVPLNRYFVNLSWNSIKNIKNKQWKYDFTINGVGNQRLVENSLNSNFNESPSFSIINSQLTRVFSNLFEAYIGIENLGNFTQKNPIIFENDSFNNKFDTSQIWAPILGRMFYLGLRYKI
tara:strand:- start:2819 stop:5011 length:2193 start_codon:yes stop_codon:yes gene_type:complete